MSTPEAAAPPLSAKEHHAASVALYRWFADWSETARSVIEKRAYLITLSLAKRKASSKKEAAPVEPAASPTA